MKSLKSLSSKSVRLAKSSKFGDLMTEAPPGFEAALYEACLKYNCPYKLHVKTVAQPDIFLKKLKDSEPAAGIYKKITVMPHKASSLHVESDRKVAFNESITKSEQYIDPNALIITAVCDNAQNLVEVVLNKIKQVPRSLILIMSYLFPIHDRLKKISLLNCIIDVTIVHELNNIISHSTITDLNFDGTIFPIEYLSVLLDNESSTIKYLSLCGCEINDEICKDIATRLCFSKHSEKTLMVLNLSSNRITDEGAKHISEALRTNRHLRYLNIADNHIGNGGAISIFNSLMEFPLTHDEVMNKRRSVMEFWKVRRSLFTQLFNDLQIFTTDKLDCKPTSEKIKTSSISKGQGKRGNEVKAADVNPSVDSKAKSDFFSGEFFSTFSHPFAKNNTEMREDKCYCLGNMVLCYLNVSYNNLTFPSLKKLVSVIQYQKSIKRGNQTGLMKVVIEGNNLPCACNEYQIINDLTRITKSMVPFSRASRMSDVSRKSQRSLTIKRK